MRLIQRLATATALGMACFSASAANASYDWSALDSYLHDPARNPVPDGSLIIRHKTEVHRVYWGGWSTGAAGGYASNGQADVARNIASVSKSYGAAVALMAQDDPTAAFNVTSLVTDNFTDASSINAAYATMTVRELMSMTAGIVPLTNLNSCLGRDAYTFMGCVKVGIVPKPLWNGVSPGQNFVYSGADWNVMGWTVLNAIQNGYRTHGYPNYPNTSWADEATGYLFAPCGWTATQYQQAQNFWVGGGLQSNLEEGGEMANLLLDGTCTNANGQPVTLLSSNSLIKMRQDQYLPTGAVLGETPYSSVDSTDGGNRAQRHYGYGLFLNNAGPLANATRNGLYFGPGAWGSHVFFDSSRKYSGFLYVKENFTDGSKLFEAIVPMVEAQVNNNL